MNLSTIPKSDLQEELERREGAVYRGEFKHKSGCDSSVVNPLTEWCGGSEVVITGYKCERCGMITKSVVGTKMNTCAKNIVDSFRMV